MDKVKNFLERYVEWLAVLLGVAFLGWMIFGYVINKPVSTSVGSNATASPAEVDPLVWEGPGQQIQGELGSKTPPPPMGPTVDYAQVAKESRDKAPASVIAKFEGTYIPLSPTPDMSGGGAVAGVPHAPLAGHVTQLPDAPALITLQVSEGHSNVPAPEPPAAAGAIQPAAANPAQAVDMNWRTIAGMIPVAELAKSFDGCKIPQMFSSTAILRVKLVRQERDGSGNWGPETEIAPLETNVLQDMPANNASGTDQKDYFEWAEKNVELIAAPKFFQVLQGDVWYEPGTKSPNQVDIAVVEDGFDPKNALGFKGDPNTLTPDEKKQYDSAKAREEKRQAAKQRNSNNRNNQPPQSGPDFNPFSGPPGGEGGRRSPAVPDPGRNGYNGQRPPDFFPGPANHPGMPNFQPGMPPEMQMSGGGGSSANTTLPQGSFNPATQGNIKIWAHDVTVQPGKTYRYKMRYVLSNPVARTMGLCVPQSLAAQFYIESPFSTWTDPVSVESDTNFYAIDTKHGVHFEIFKWKNGTYQMQSVQVTPGDMVGSVDAGSGADFTTHWTLVDVREDPRDETNKTIVLVSDNGTALKKELSIDQHSAQYRRLLEQVNANKDKTAGGAPNTLPG